MPSPMSDPRQRGNAVPSNGRRQGAKKTSTAMIWLGFGAAGVVLLVLLAVLPRGGDDDPPKRPPKPKTPAAAEPPPRPLERPPAGNGPGTMGDLMRSGDQPPAEAVTVTSHLAAARRAMAEKDVPAARRAADAAVQLASSPTERSEAERVQLLVTSLEAFWKGVEGAMKRLQSGRELEYGGKRVMVVEARPDLLAFREEGRMRLYAPADMPAELAVALAERSLKRQDPNVNLHVGSFLATDPRGDRDEARRRWEQSGELGKRFLAELRLPQ